MVAKVADFGLSKLRAIGHEDATHITTIVKRTTGYLDPEYHETGLLMDKSDVYAFGIVLMEILTGLHPMKIANRVRKAWISELLDDLVDPNLGEDNNGDEFESIVELALWCVKLKSFERSCMRQVVQRFRKIGLISIEPPPPKLNVRLGEEARNVEAFEIISVESDIAPLTESSSFSGMSSDARFHSRRLQSRQSMMI